MVYRHHSCHGFRVSFSSHCARSSSPRARGQRRFRDVRVQVHVLLRRKRLGVVRVKDTSQFHDTILRSRHRRRRARSVPPPRDLALPDNRFTSNLNARALAPSLALRVAPASVPIPPPAPRVDDPSSHPRSSLRVLVRSSVRSMRTSARRGKSHFPYVFKETPFSLRQVSFSLRCRRENETSRGG